MKIAVLGSRLTPRVAVALYEADAVSPADRSALKSASRIVDIIETIDPMQLGTGSEGKFDSGIMKRKNSITGKRPPTPPKRIRQNADEAKKQGFGDTVGGMMKIFGRDWKDNELEGFDLLAKRRPDVLLQDLELGKEGWLHILKAGVKKLVIYPCTIKDLDLTQEPDWGHLVMLEREIKFVGWKTRSEVQAGTIYTLLYISRGCTSVTFDDCAIHRDVPFPWMPKIKSILLLRSDVRTDGWNEDYSDLVESTGSYLNDDD